MAELNEVALAELRRFTAEFERRPADRPPVESVPPATLRVAREFESCQLEGWQDSR